MPRDITSAMLTQLNASQVKLAVFVEIFFTSGTLNLWSGVGNKSWDSKNWIGTGSLLSVTPATESSDLRANGAVITLDGVDPALISVALQEGRQGRPVNCWLGFLDLSTEAVIVDPAAFFKGRLDVMAINDGAETATIAVQAESRLIDLERPSNRRYTQEDHQRDYPSDLGFEHVNSIQEWQGSWGVGTGYTVGGVKGGRGIITPIGGGDNGGGGSITPPLRFNYD